MNLTIFISMLFALQILYWFVGRCCSKQTNTQEDYFLAGKNVKLFPLTMTFLATQVGGGIILGAADEAYLFGWPVIFYPLGAALGLILLGCGLGKKLAGFNVSTVAEIFEVVYKSPRLKKTASLLSIISLFMILVAQIMASSKFLMSMGFDNTPLFIIFWGIVILYTAQGGLNAVISTDMVQAGFFSFVFLACFGWVYWMNPEGALVSAPQLESLEGVSSKLCGWLLMPLLFMVIEQDMGQRCFAGSSSKTVSKAALLAGIGTLIVCIVPVYFGSLARSLNLDIPEGSSVLMSVINRTTNPWFSALVGCAVLAAIVSTATSLINAISSNISSDFSFSKNQSLKKLQATTFILATAAIFFSFYFNNIVDLLIQSYELSVSCLFVPIIMALYKKNGSYSAALLSVLFGVAGFILFRFIPLPIPREIATLILSFTGFGLGELLSLSSLNKLNFLKD